jgi:pantoate--beta-alanine ligase
MTTLVTDLSTFREITRVHPRAAVFTMGALHAGHIELVKAARKVVGSDGEIVLTIFVNPTQFTESADLENYPRTLEADFALCVEAGVDIVLAPSVADVFAQPIPQVSSGVLGQLLEGVSRPGHFDAVATIVAHLLDIAKPEFTFFGEKDFQQLTVVKHMVQSANMSVTVIGVPTVRDSTGLALSSRNSRLSESGKKIATKLMAAMQIAEQELLEGNKVEAAISAARTFLDAFPEIQVDYLELVDYELKAVAPESSLEIGTPARLMIAAYIDGVRLIDNLGVMRR